MDSGPVLILDGAVGTELEKMGVPMHGEVWCAAALDTHPDTVRQLHEDYINAGADIITSNSYASSPHNLESAGLGDRAVELNALSIKLVREAIANAAPKQAHMGCRFHVQLRGVRHQPERTQPFAVPRA